MAQHLVCVLPAPTGACLVALRDLERISGTPEYIVWINLVCQAENIMDISSPGWLFGGRGTNTYAALKWWAEVRLLLTEGKGLKAAVGSRSKPIQLCVGARSKVLQHGFPGCDRIALAKSLDDRPMLPLMNAPTSGDSTGHEVRDRLRALQ